MVSLILCAGGKNSFNTSLILYIIACLNFLNSLFRLYLLSFQHVLTRHWFDFSFSSVKNELLPAHPLEIAEKNVSMPHR